MEKKRPDLPDARVLIHTRDHPYGEFQDSASVKVTPAAVHVSVARVRNPRYISETTSLVTYDRVVTSRAIEQCEIAVAELKTMIQKLKTRRENLCLED